VNRQVKSLGASVVHTRLRMLLVAAGAAVALGSTASSALGDITSTWIAPTGTWSAGANWQGGVPASGVTTALNFTSGNGIVTATNDIAGNPFQMHAMSFNVNNTFTVAWTAGNKFQFANNGSTSPTISMNGLGNATLSSATTAGVELADNLTFGGTGPGNLTISGLLSETGGARSITVAGGNPTADLRILFMPNVANVFSGGLILDGGTVGLTGISAQSFGAAGSTFTVTPNGGTLVGSFTSPTTLGVLQLNGDLRIISAGFGLGTTTANGLLQGSSTLYDLGAAVTINSNSGSGAASPFTGAVVLSKPELPQMATAGGGGLTLRGVAGNTTTAGNGSLNQAASFVVQTGGNLTLDNNGGATITQNGDRIGDTTPLLIRTGVFVLSGPGATAASPTSLTETIGDLTSGGNARIAATSNSTGSVMTTIVFRSLSRADRGTFTFHGSPSTASVSTMGNGVTANRSRIMLTNPLAGAEFVGGGGADGSTNISILPYAVGGQGTGDAGSSFVTYGADGFRLLQPAEYFTSTDLDASPPGVTDNMRLTAATPHSGTHTINALVLASNSANTTDGSLTGTGTLTITSGAIISTAGHASNTTNNIAFGTAEGMITTGNTSILTLSGNLTGTNGLTRNGATSLGTVVLSGDNSGLTGQLTMNAGTLQFNSALAFPGGTDPIVVNGGPARNDTNGYVSALSSASPSAWTMSRPIAINSGFLTFRLNNQSVTPQVTLGSLTVDSAITGAGGVDFEAQTITNPGHIYVTNPGNTYSGVTRFGAGNTHVTGEGSLGNGGAWEFAGGNMILEGSDLSNSRRINFSSTSQTTINLNGHNATFNGPITGYAASGFTGATGVLNLSGPGTLTLTNPINLIGGAVNITGGTLLINGNLGASTSTLSVNSGGTLGGSGTIYRNVQVTVGGTLAPGNSPGILSVVGNLTLSATANVRMELNGPAAGTGYDQVVASSSATTGATVAIGTNWANLVLSLGFAPANNSKFWLINNTNTRTGSTTGAFVGLPEGSVVTLGTFGGVTYTGTISYTGNFDTGQADGSGNDVVIYGVVNPNPTGSCCVFTGGSFCFGGDTADQCATRGGTFTPGGACTGPSSCNAGHFCGSADFNCDGDIGTDSDISAFFACLSGQCPGLPCVSNADFNGDGDIGTDTDIEAFFRVLGGGGC
jgi:fibronectin-binding autotransporter adhesin